MTRSSQAQSDEDGATIATFVSQRGDKAASNVTSEDSPAEELRDFNLAAGDKIDLTDVAAHFRMKPDEVRENLYLTEVAGATEVGVAFDGIPFSIVVVRGVDAAALKQAAPWVFDQDGSAAIPQVQVDVPAQVGQSNVRGPAPDEFVFDETVPYTVPKGVVVPAKPADIAQLALALGLTEAQVMDALRERGFSPTGDPAADAAAASAALSGADALVL